jgi:hypothetical protein
MTDQRPLHIRFPPENIEMAVINAIKESLLARQSWEAERGQDDPPLEEGRVVLQGAIAHLRCHGHVISHLALLPETRAELRTRMADAIDFVPAWMEARVYGVETMTGRLYACGLCQVLREHRAAIEQVISEQIENPEHIEEVLAEAPIPEARDGETGSEIMNGGGEAMRAHMEVLVAIARVLDEFFESFAK